MSVTREQIKEALHAVLAQRERDDLNKLFITDVKNHLSQANKNGETLTYIKWRNRTEFKLKASITAIMAQFSAAGFNVEWCGTHNFEIW